MTFARNAVALALYGACHPKDMKPRFGGVVVALGSFAFWSTGQRSRHNSAVGSTFIGVTRGVWGGGGGNDGHADESDSRRLINHHGNRTPTQPSRACGTRAHAMRCVATHPHPPTGSKSLCGSLSLRARKRLPRCSQQPTPTVSPAHLVAVNHADERAEFGETHPPATAATWSPWRTRRPSHPRTPRPIPVQYAPSGSPPSTRSPDRTRSPAATRASTQAPTSDRSTGTIHAHPVAPRNHLLSRSTPSQTPCREWLDSGFSARGGRKGGIATLPEYKPGAFKTASSLIHTTW